MLRESADAPTFSRAQAIDLLVRETAGLTAAEIGRLSEVLAHPSGLKGTPSDIQACKARKAVARATLSLVFVDILDQLGEIEASAERLLDDLAYHADGETLRAAAKIHVAARNIRSEATVSP